MGRVKVSLLAALGVALLASLSACGGSKGSTGPQLPASVTLSPSTGSLDVGGTLGFIATARDRSKNILGNVAFTFTSSNPAVLTVSATGVACAGTWDSLIIPRVCTPGGAGIANVTVSADGVTSSPVQVFVHQHIDTITVSQVTPAPGTPNPGAGPCFTASTTTNTVARSETLQALAFNGTTDITSTVGQINWTAVTPAVVTVTPLADPSGTLTGEVQATAKAPGTTQIFASVGGANSAPHTFTTCPVASISFLINGIAGNVINAPKSTAQKIDALVTDTSGSNLATAPLTWGATNPTLVGTLPTSASTFSASGSGPGGTSITAACIPPTCNINFSPMQAVYPTAAVDATFTGAPSTTAPTVDVSSSGCGTTLNCTSTIVSISGANNTVSNPVALTGTPNSFQYGPRSTSVVAYLGSEEGLNVFKPSTVTSNAALPGKVLAVSPDGNSVVVSETSPGVFNQVFILNSSNGALTSLPIAGAVTAAFSPDGLKVFIATSTGKLFVFSTEAALQTNITLPNLAPPNSPTEAIFHPAGGFGFVAGLGGLSFLATCDNPTAPAVGTAAAPGSLFIRSLPGGRFITLAPPNVEIVSTTITGTGCSQTLTVPGSTTTNLGQGNFVPVDFLVSSDGTKAYIPIQGSASILVFDIAGSSISSIALVGNPSPVSASLTADGTLLYVGASDGSVHKLDTSLGTDVAQIPIAANTLCAAPSGPSPACLPNFVRVRP